MAVESRVFGWKRLSGTCYSLYYSFSFHSKVKQEYVIACYCRTCALFVFVFRPGIVLVGRRFPTRFPAQAPAPAPAPAQAPSAVEAVEEEATGRPGTYTPSNPSTYTHTDTCIPPDTGPGMVCTRFPEVYPAAGSEVAAATVGSAVVAAAMADSAVAAEAAEAEGTAAGRCTLGRTPK